MTLSLRLLSSHNTTDFTTQETALAPWHFKEFTILENGKPIGVIDSTFHTRDNRIFIGGITLTDDEGLEIESKDAANALGPAKIRQLLRLLKAEFPEAETIGGMRVSGARRIHSATEIKI